MGSGTQGSNLEILSRQRLGVSNCAGTSCPGAKSLPSYFTALIDKSQLAFNDFVGTCIEDSDIQPGTELVKAMEKSLIRSAELALPSMFDTLD